MRYAIVENGIVTNTIFSEPDFAAKIDAIELPDGYGIGDNWNGETWTKAPQPEPDPADVPPEQPQPGGGVALTQDQADFIAGLMEGLGVTAEVVQA